MLIRKLCILFSVVILVSQFVFVIIWGEVEVVDFILIGEICQVFELVSYGSYIYYWLSKYDQVFWFYIDQYGIWVCEVFGFVGLIGDFIFFEQEKVVIIYYFLVYIFDNMIIVGKLEMFEVLIVICDLDGDECNYMK